MYEDLTAKILIVHVWRVLPLSLSLSLSLSGLKLDWFEPKKLVNGVINHRGGQVVLVVGGCDYVLCVLH